MAIRIRRLKTGYIALCAAESKAQEGDIYLNDGIHTALTKKFDKDFRTMGFIKDVTNERTTSPNNQS